MKVLAVFHDKESYHWANRWLKKGFWHVFAVIQDDQGYWIRIDAQDGRPCVEVVGDKTHDMVELYESQGFTVLAFETDPVPLPVMIVGNCVGVIKSILGISNFFIFTPWQLYLELYKRRMYSGGPAPTKWATLPGESAVKPIKKVVTAPFEAIGDVFSPDMPKPDKLPETPDLAAATTAATETALEDRRKIARKGRAATMITGGTGITTPLGAVNRPEAFRAAQVLGQVG